jgi:hypothetical protein
VAWAPEAGIFLAVALSGTANRFMISKNGINWYSKSSLGIDFSYYTVVWSPPLGRFVMSVTSGNYLYYSNSTLSSNFTYPSLNINILNKKAKKTITTVHNITNSWKSAYNNLNANLSSVLWISPLNKYVALSTTEVFSGNNNQNSMTSLDGITWSGSVISSTDKWNNLCYSDELSLIVAVGSNSDGTAGVVSTSTDGVSWTSRTSATSGAWDSVCWSPELTLFVAVGDYLVTTDNIMTSPDGINWTARTFSNTKNWSSVCWSLDLTLFVAVSTTSSTSSIITSPDGINWTARSTSSAVVINSVCWSSELKMFVACNSNGTILTSFNGVAWSSQTIVASLILSSVNWVQELNAFILLSKTGRVFISFDGFTWSSKATLSGSTNWLSLTWSTDYSMLLGYSSDATGTNLAISQFASPTYKNTVITNPSYVTVDNVNGRVGLGVSAPTNQLQLSSDSAAKPSTTTWTVSSDSRLKEDIVNADLDICYNNIKNLRLTKYTWKDDVYTEDQVSDRSKLGWIAQEVEEYLPKAVKKNNDHGLEDCRSLDIDQIIASLYGCVQKLMTKCEERDTTIAALTAKHNELKEVIDSIEFEE